MPLPRAARAGPPACMSPSDLFILIARWLHALAAVAWVGGGIFYLLALRPALRNHQYRNAVNQLIAQEFKNVVDIALWVLVVTGAVLFLNRATSQYATSAYGVVLAVKIALAVWMVYLVGFRQRGGANSLSDHDATDGRPVLGRLRAAFSATYLLLILGVTIFFLSDLLRELFEREILSS